MADVHNKWWIAKVNEVTKSTSRGKSGNIIFKRDR